MLETNRELGSQMKLTLRQQLTQFAHVLQSSLFPTLEEELGMLGERAKRLVATLEMIPLARFVPRAREPVPFRR